MHSTSPSAGCFAGLGGIVTVIYTAQNEAPAKKSRFTLLPFLVVLFIISYGILTLLVVEQGRTIETQRILVRELMKDSTELSGLKIKIGQEKAAAARNHNGASKEPGSKNPPGDTEAQTDQAKPVPNGTGKDGKIRNKSRTTKEVPEAPAADLQDVRRAKRVI